MRKNFDSRVVTTRVLELVRVCQAHVECHLGGGAALAGAYLGHRMTGDVDIFVHDSDAMRYLVGLLPGIAASVDVTIVVQRDVGHLVRARIESTEGCTELDIVHDPVADIVPPPPPLDGVIVESLEDLRANKLTCILSRSEPRDLVDLLYLDRAGYPPDGDLDLALRKDSGIDPGVIAWLLAQFPLQPLPVTFEPLSVVQLGQYRDALAERFRLLTLG